MELSEGVTGRGLLDSLFKKRRKKEDSSGRLAEGRELTKGSEVKRGSHEGCRGEKKSCQQRREVEGSVAEGSLGKCWQMA